MRCEFGYCIVCDKEIASQCDKCDTRKPNEFYTEVVVTWSNGSKMHVAVCTECAQNHRIYSVDKMELTKAVQKAWDKQGGKYDPEVKIVG